MLSIYNIATPWHFFHMPSIHSVYLKKKSQSMHTLYIHGTYQINAKKHIKVIVSIYMNYSPYIHSIFMLHTRYIWRIWGHSLKDGNANLPDSLWPAAMDRAHLMYRICWSLCYLPRPSTFEFYTIAVVKPNRLWPCLPANNIEPKELYLKPPILRQLNLNYNK